MQASHTLFRAVQIGDSDVIGQTVPRISPWAAPLRLLVAAMLCGLVGSSIIPRCEAAPLPKVGQQVEVKRSPFEDIWEQGVVVEEFIRGRV